MTQNNPQVPWTDEQWNRVNQAIQEEANRARVAASFLPLYGPLPPDTDFVRANIMHDGSPKPDRTTRAQPQPGETPGPRQRLTIDDVTTIPLMTLQVKVFLRGAQMADPEMTSAMQLFRRAANILARLEDAVVFNGQTGPNEGPPPGTIEGLPPQPIWQALGGQKNWGLLGEDPKHGAPMDGNQLVSAVSYSIGKLEQSGHFGPFAVVLDHNFFTAVQTPNADSLVLPQDRIIPFLSGGSLLRSSTLPDRSGVVVALGGAPVELVVATDVTLNTLQVTTDPMFVFRVYEKIVLRIKEPDAIKALVPYEPANSPAPTQRSRRTPR
jgi:uncharacterized linocin/CFP29 family protein